MDASHFHYQRFKKNTFILLNDPKVSRQLSANGFSASTIVADETVILFDYTPSRSKAVPLRLYARSTVDVREKGAKGPSILTTTRGANRSADTENSNEDSLMLAIVTETAPTSM